MIKHGKIMVLKKVQKKITLDDRDSDSSSVVSSCSVRPSRPRSCKSTPTSSPQKSTPGSQDLTEALQATSVSRGGRHISSALQAPSGSRGGRNVSLGPVPKKA